MVAVVGALNCRQKFPKDLCRMHGCWQLVPQNMCRRIFYLFIYLFIIREITRCRILALGGLQSVHDRIHRPFPCRNICYIITFIIVIVTIIIIISSSSSSICGSFICLQPQCDPIHCVSSSQIYEYLSAG